MSVSHEYRLTGYYYFIYLEQTNQSINQSINQYMSRWTISIISESVYWNRKQDVVGQQQILNLTVSYKLLKKTTPKMIMWDATVGFVGRG